MMKLSEFMLIEMSEVVFVAMAEMAFSEMMTLAVSKMAAMTQPVTIMAAVGVMGIIPIWKDVGLVILAVISDIIIASIESRCIYFFGPF